MLVLCSFGKDQNSRHSFENCFLPIMHTGTNKFTVKRMQRILEILLSRESLQALPAENLSDWGGGQCNLKDKQLQLENYWAKSNKDQNCKKETSG